MRASTIGTDVYPLIRARGDAVTRGRMYGMQTRARIARTLEAYVALFHYYADMDWSGVTAYARRYEDIIGRYDHELIDEMRGIAEGASVDFVDILAINVRTEVMYGLGGLKAVECTSFAALPAATASGHTLLGQNWDWHPRAMECCIVLSLEQLNRPSILTVVEAGLLAKTGMNSAGMGVVTNALVSDIDRGDPGIPYHVVLRSILNTLSFEEAVDVVREARRASSANYVIAGRSGQAINLEAAPGGPDHVFPIETRRGVVGHANCFVAPDACVGDETARLRPLGRLRQATIDRHLGEHGELTIERLQDVLRDHANHPNSMCRHPLADVPAMQRSASVASVLMDLDASIMWVADGPPCEHAYRRFEAHQVWGQA